MIITGFNRDELISARDYWYNHMECGNEEQNKAAWAAINAINYCLDISWKGGTNAEDDMYNKGP